MLSEETRATSSSRLGKSQQAEAAFWRLMEQASRRGFYGSVGLTLTVQDGRVQHVRMSTEQTLK